MNMDHSKDRADRISGLFYAFFLAIGNCVRKDTSIRAQTSISYHKISAFDIQFFAAVNFTDGKIKGL